MAQQQKTPLREHELRQVREWVAVNRGVLTRIARDVKVSPQFVHQCLRKLRQSEDGRVERLLRQAGAPL